MAANARKKASLLEDDAQAPAIWLITDSKPDHRNQLRGLAGRLRALTGAKLYWLNAADYPVPLWRALLGLAPTVDKALPQPDLIVAAGSGTHRLLLALRRYRKAKTLVLMKPAFPLNWVDGAIIPAHDDVKPSKTVLNTEGVINAITPLAALTDKPNALILVGGPSQHFDWNNDTITSQISDLIARYPRRHWTITDSRRTPEALYRRLTALQSKAGAVVQSGQTDDDCLKHQLAPSRAVWVAPDSMSMVCEAATAGVPTCTFHLPPPAGSRVVNGISRLARLGLVAH